MNMATNFNSTPPPMANFSNGSVLRLTVEPPAVRVFRLALQTLTFVVGTVGNVFVVIITSKKRNLKIVGNRFILSLAIADMGILLISFPIHILSIDFPFSWPFGEFFCQTVLPFTDIFYGVEIGCITAIAFHRYKMLVHCMKPQMTVQTAKRVLFLIWLLSFIIIVMPLLFVMELEKARSGLWVCNPNFPNRVSLQTYYLSKVLAFYLVPLVIISITYVRIRTKLRENIRKHDSVRRSSLGERTGKKDIISRVVQNRRAMRLLTPVVVAFAICMAPISTYSLLAHVCFVRITNFVLVRFFLLLLVANSSVNPIIYSVVNPEFRREFLRLLRCRGENCCSETTEGLSLSKFRRTSSNARTGRSNRSSFLLKRKDVSSSSSRKSTSRNSADKTPKESDSREEIREAEN